MSFESIQLDAVISTPDKRTAIAKGKGTATATNTTSFNSTPFARKLSGNPNAKKSLTHVHMDPALKEELFESQLLDVPGLVEHLFPDSLFPVSFATLEAAVVKKHWNKRLEDWKDYNPINAASLVLGAGEAALARWLQGISETLFKACQVADSSSSIVTDREWVSACFKPLTGGPPAKRKPDVCLTKKGQDLTWMSALVTVELKKRASDYKNAHLQLTNSAYMVFSTQDERRFHIGVSVCCTDVYVYVFDRAGVVGSKKFHLSTNSKLLIRLLAGLTLADSDAIGFDSSIRHHENGTRSIYINKLEYQLVKTLFISDSIRGRGTVCWQARRGDADFVIKNTWTDMARIQTEAEILKLAEDVEGIAHLVAEEIVQHNSKDDSTAHIRSILGDLKEYKRRSWFEKLEVRLHRRLVTTPVAEGLTFFKSKKELLTVLIDAIEAHARLVEKHILHRDVSMANVMIYRPLTAEVTSETTSSQDPVAAPANSGTTETTNPVAKGILIDLDYAMITHDTEGKKIERQVDATGHRTGTLPFMAIEILRGLKPGQEHQAYHDIESFFYILLWITLQYAGPGNVERQDKNIENSGQIRGWTQGNSIKEIAISKATTMLTDAEIFNEGVTSQCTPYFTDLVPIIEELRQKIFLGAARTRQKATHQDIIDILRKPLTWLPDDDGWSPGEVHDESGPIKRSIDDVEEEDEDSSAEQSSPIVQRVKRARTAPTRPHIGGSRQSARLRSIASLQKPN